MFYHNLQKKSKSIHIFIIFYIDLKKKNQRKTVIKKEKDNYTFSMSLNNRIINNLIRQKYHFEAVLCSNIRRTELSKEFSGTKFLDN